MLGSLGFIRNYGVFVVCGEKCLCVCALGGADFEIIPMNNICLLTTFEQAHFVLPHVLAAPSVAGQPDLQCWKRGSQSRGIETRQATHLGDPEDAVSELGDDASSPSSACIAFKDCRASAKLVLLLSEGISSSFVPRDYAVLYPISRSNTEPQNPPHRVECVNDMVHERISFRVALEARK